jgi:hypothetical protein
MYTMRGEEPRRRQHAMMAGREREVEREDGGEAGRVRGEGQQIHDEGGRRTRWERKGEETGKKGRGRRETHYVNSTGVAGRC